MYNMSSSCALLALASTCQRPFCTDRTLRCPSDKGATRRGLLSLGEKAIQRGVLFHPYGGTSTPCAGSSQLGSRINVWRKLQMRKVPKSSLCNA